MQFIEKPKPLLLPPLPKKDCFLKLCTPTCLKWCDGFFPPTSPPPPLTFPNDKSQNSPTFSPLVIAIIGILASAFLLVSYYAIISKYCGNSSDSRRNRDPPNNNEETMEEDFNGSFRHEPNQHEPWLITTQGLDEALIKTITLVKYKKGDGLVGSCDCSVCLGEFLEDDTLRLLPKCSHAFHVACIDTWLRSHSNCPLCRANIISNFVTTNQPPNITTLNNPSLVVDNDHDLNINVVQENQGESEEISSSEEGRQMGISGENLPKTSNAQFRALSDLGVRGYIGRDPMRRSISMDHFRYETRVSSDVLRYNNHGEEECVVKICQFHDQALKMADNGESSKFGVCNSSSSSSRSGVLQCVMSSVAMKRSFSSGRFLFSKHGRGRNAVIPL